MEDTKQKIAMIAAPIYAGIISDGITEANTSYAPNAQKFYGTPFCQNNDMDTPYKRLKKRALEESLEIARRLYDEA